MEIEQEKPKLGWRWLLCLPALLVLLFIGQMWGPNPKIRVSPQTTRIDSHLGRDGLPDYMAYLHDRISSGVTPENNSAALYWKALWPGELSMADGPMMAEALGISEPDPDESLVPIYSPMLKGQLVDYLKKELSIGSGRDEDFDADSEAEQILDHVLSQSMYRPWTSEKIPLLGEWAEKNDQQLDWLVEGGDRSEYYSPSPSMLQSKNDGLILMLLPGAQSLRSGARALTCRAMWHLGEGRAKESWRDLKACHRMARHATKGTTLVHHLIGFAIEGMSVRATQTLLHHGDLSADEAGDILRDLDEMSYIPTTDQKMDEGERLAFLDSVIRLSKGEWSLSDFGMMAAWGGGGTVNSDVLVDFTTSTRIDWNRALQEGNVWFDRLSESARLPRSERKQAIHEMAAEISALSPARNSTQLVGSLVSSTARSNMMADALVRLFIPAVSAVAEASDRSNTHFDITRLMAALAIYRAEQGEYPKRLEQLSPDILPELPVDVYSGKSYIYRKRDSGFLLYSVFTNGIDDGGTDFNGQIVNGKWADDADTNIDYDNTDLVVLMPQPEIEFSKAR